MANLFDVRSGDLHAFEGRLSDAGFTPQLIEAALQNDSTIVAAMMRAALQEASLLGADNGIFTPPEDQLRIQQQWNMDLEPGFTKDEFAEAKAAIPDPPKAGPFAGIVLVPYLGNANATYEALWKMVRYRKDTARVSENQFTCRGTYELHDQVGTNEPTRGLDLHPRGLRWEVIDFAANRGRMLRFDLCMTRLPAAGILAAAAHHPRWVQALKQGVAPLPILGGYVLNMREKKKMFTDMMSHGPLADKGPMHLSLSAYSDGLQIDWTVPQIPDERYCIPAFVR